jgi:hypothetical protein
MSADSPHDRSGAPSDNSKPSEAQIWYTRSAEQRVLSSELENVIVLTDDFYREVTEHRSRTILIR